MTQILAGAKLCSLSHGFNHILPKCSVYIWIISWEANFFILGVWFERLIKVRGIFPSWTVLKSIQTQRISTLWNAVLVKKKLYTTASRRKCSPSLYYEKSMKESLSQTVTEKIIQLKLLGIGNGGSSSNTNWVIRSFECKTTTRLTFFSLSICTGFIFRGLFWRLDYYLRSWGLKKASFP